MNFLFQLIIGIVFMLLAAILRPKPKTPKAQDIQAPTASASKPIPVVFGSVQIKSPNCLFFGQAAHVERDAEGGGKK